MRLILKYVYGTVERTTDEMHGKDEDFRGNAYGHIIKNGMEILRRLASAATIAEQKKLVLLMLKQQYKKYIRGISGKNSTDGSRNQLVQY